jgi:hypothetical protein
MLVLLQASAVGMLMLLLQASVVGILMLLLQASVVSLVTMLHQALASTYRVVVAQELKSGVHVLHIEKVVKKSELLGQKRSSIYVINSRCFYYFTVYLMYALLHACMVTTRLPVHGVRIGGGGGDYHGW